MEHPDVGGVWHVQIPAGTSARSYVLRLQQEFQEVRGTITTEGHDIPITGAALVGDHLRFTANTGGQGQMSFDGRVDTNLMHGRVEIRGGPLDGWYDWTSQREVSGAGGTPPR